MVSFAPAIALLVAVVIGLALYGRFASAGGSTVAVFGLLRNGSLFLIGLFLIIGDTGAGLVVGGLLVVIAIFLGSTHADNLADDSLRRRLSG